MSFEVTNAVWKHSEQKSGTRLVLLALADYTNNEGIAWPAVSTLAQKVRMSERQVQRCVRKLEKDGELEVRRNKGSRGSNIYRILLSRIKSNTADAHVVRDGRVAKTMSPPPSIGDTSVAQSVSKPLKESTPIVPSGDDKDFWINVCFECFNQSRHPLPRHVVCRLAQAIPGLDKKTADSLRKFYHCGTRDSKEQPFNSRRHSPERLMTDLRRQVAFAVEIFPPPRSPKEDPFFTLEDVCQYLDEKYGECSLPPHSLAQFNSFSWAEVRREFLEAMRMKNKKKVP